MSRTTSVPRKMAFCLLCCLLGKNCQRGTLGGCCPRCAKFHAVPDQETSFFTPDLLRSLDRKSSSLICTNCQDSTKCWPAYTVEILRTEKFIQVDPLRTNLCEYPWKDLDGNIDTACVRIIADKQIESVRALQYLSILCPTPSDVQGETEDGRETFQLSILLLARFSTLLYDATCNITKVGSSDQAKHFMATRELAVLYCGLLKVREGLESGTIRPLITESEFAKVLAGRLKDWEGVLYPYLGKSCSSTQEKWDESFKCDIERLRRNVWSSKIRITTNSCPTHTRTGSNTRNPSATEFSLRDTEKSAYDMPVHLTSKKSSTDLLGLYGEQQPPFPARNGLSFGSFVDEDIQLPHVDDVKWMATSQPDWIPFSRTLGGSQITTFISVPGSVSSDPAQAGVGSSSGTMVPVPVARNMDLRHIQSVSAVPRSNYVGVCLSQNPSLLQGRNRSTMMTGTVGRHLDPEANNSPGIPVMLHSQPLSSSSSYSSFYTPSSYGVKSASSQRLQTSVGRISTEQTWRANDNVGSVSSGGGYVWGGGGRGERSGANGPFEPGPFDT